MRLIIDLQAVQGASRLRGIGRYSLGLVNGLLRNRGEHEIFIVLNGLLPCVDEIRATFSDMVPNENFLVWDAPGEVEAIVPGNDARREAAELIRESALASLAPDYILILSLFEGLHEKLVTSIGRLTSIPTAVILYDLIPLIHRRTYLPDLPTEKWYENKLGHLRNADLLLAISEASRQEALDWLGSDDEQVINISTAADDHFTPEPLSRETRAHLEREYGLNRPFVMYTGNTDPRKNTEGLIRAFARLPAQVRQAHQLAIVTPLSEASRQHLLKLAAEEGIADGDMILTGHIPEDDLLACYRGCKLFVFPSWHEGFGLPALEAMKCGRAVVASDRSGLPEVIGLEGALFDPFDVNAISAKMREVLTDDRLREELERHGLEQAAKFDWDITARRAWAALETSHARGVRPGEHLASLPSRRPRLAFLSPLAPDTSGISDYSAELLPELARYYRIEIVTPHGVISDPWVLGNCPIRDVDWFRRHAHEFDRILYQFGNSSFHSHMFDLLHDIPGVITLHDFFLSGIIDYRDKTHEKPGAWAQALYHSHGWQAVSRRYKERDTGAMITTYPCNRQVLQDALGVIVHAEHSKQLARDWYGLDAANDWQLVPHLRRSSNMGERRRSRKVLGLNEDDFVVCSFGILALTKMNHRLLEAWLASPLARDPKCQLVFVGENDPAEYGARIRGMISSSEAAGRIKITGWVDQATFRHWLNAADLAVQLRQFSRGETSGTVLDCMNNGVATIVNPHGSLMELPRDAVFMLDDDFSDADLKDALVTLWRNKTQRRELADKARAHIQRHHQPRRCAAAYAEAIERYYAKAASGEHGLLRALVGIDTVGDLSWEEVSKSVARTLPHAPRPKRLLVDVSVVAHNDLRTGIERVTRAILAQWIKAPPPGWMVEPIRSDFEGQCYRYARKFTSRFLEIPDGWCEDDVVETYPGDVFVGLDWDRNGVTQLHALLQEWWLRGVKLHFVLYDLLPTVLPEYFPPGMKAGHEHWLETISRFDGVTCISRAMADEFRNWLEQYGPKRERPLAINWFHIGADIQNSAPTRGKPADATQVLALLRGAPSFLAVGTIEPRKGHRQLLAAFEILWSMNMEVNLVFVGKLGWMMEDFAELVRTQPQFGKRLFWLESISDEYLDDVYAACSFLVAASEGEGFGLPLVEAARHGLPVLARDIPVFREVAGQNATFFTNNRDPRVIAEAVAGLLRGSSVPIPQDKQSWLTWEQSARDLLECVLERPTKKEDSQVDIRSSGSRS